MSKHLGFGGICTALVLVGCSPQQSTPGVPAEEDAAPAEAPTDTAQTSALISSLEAEQFPDSIQFILRVTNGSQQPVQLTFRSGQSFDFVVEQNGREVWRWSGDRMFTQAIRTETLPPGETETYQGAWAPAPELQGEYTVRGFLTAQEHRLEQQTTLRLP